MGGWTGRDTFIFSSLIFTQFVSFLLFFSSARTHSLFGFMPLLLFPTRQFIPVAWVSTCPVLVTRHHTLSESRGPCIHASFVFLPTYLLVALNIAVVRRLDCNYLCSQSIEINMVVDFV
jgi:hypothetical protein